MDDRRLPAPLSTSPALLVQPVQAAPTLRRLPALGWMQQGGKTILKQEFPLRSIPETAGAGQVLVTSAGFTDLKKNKKQNFLQRFCTSGEAAGWGLPEGIAASISCCLASCSITSRDSAGLGHSAHSLSCKAPSPPPRGSLAPWAAALPLQGLLQCCWFCWHRCIAAKAKQPL